MKPLSVSRIQQLIDEMPEQDKNTMLVFSMAFTLYVHAIIDAHVEETLIARGLLKPEPEPEAPAEARVYFIQAENGGPIKIGMARDVEKRLRDLQRTCGFRLTVLATESGGTRRERELHTKFAEWRLHGEWFEDCPNLVKHVGELRVEDAVA